MNIELLERIETALKAFATVTHAALPEHLRDVTRVDDIIESSRDLFAAGFVAAIPLEELLADDGGLSVQEDIDDHASTGSNASTGNDQ